MKFFKTEENTYMMPELVNDEAAIKAIDVAFDEEAKLVDYPEDISDVINCDLEYQIWLMAYNKEGTLVNDFGNALSTWYRLEDAKESLNLTCSKPEFFKLLIKELKIKYDPNLVYKYEIEEILALDDEDCFVDLCESIYVPDGEY